jgi:hypothetical protein
MPARVRWDKRVVYVIKTPNDSPRFYVGLTSGAYDPAVMPGSTDRVVVIGQLPVPSA